MLNYSVAELRLINLLNFILYYNFQYQTFSINHSTDSCYRNKLLEQVDELEISLSKYTLDFVFDIAKTVLYLLHANFTALLLPF